MLAPLALIATIAVAYLVITGDIGGLEDSDDDSSKTQATTTTGGCTPEDEQAVEDGYYVVQESDVAGLSGIADRTCIPIDRPINLNPNLDPQTLQVQNCVDLVRDGCKALAG